MQLRKRIIISSIEQQIKTQRSLFVLFIKLFIDLKFKLRDT